MIKIGIGLPGQSIADTRSSAEAAAYYNFDSFSIYGDLGDLPPYAVLHATADLLKDSDITHVGPMGIPVSLQNVEVIGMHALALREQLPNQSYIGLVRGAFLESIGEKPASLSELEAKAKRLRELFRENERDIPIYIGGFGQKVLSLAGRLPVDGVKLGGTTNPLLAKRARDIVANPNVKIVLGAVSVIDSDRKAARKLARQEVAKYLDIVGRLDQTLEPDERESLEAFLQKFRNKEPEASSAISDALLDKFAIAGKPEDAITVLSTMTGIVDRFEFGTPHGLGDRSKAIHYIGQSIIKELGIEQ